MQGVSLGYKYIGLLDVLEQGRIHDRGGSCVYAEAPLAPDAMVTGGGTIIARFAKSLQRVAYRT